MKWISAMVMMTALVECGCSIDTNKAEEKSEAVPYNSLRGKNVEPGVSEAGSPGHGHGCNFDEVVAGRGVSNLARDIYLGNERNLHNDTEALALLDSLNAKNKESRPFYFKVVTLTMKNSDGYFSEALGVAGKDFVENNTREFISNFDRNDCITNRDLMTWAEILMLEFGLEADNELHVPIIDDFMKHLYANCTDCSPAQKENLEKFVVELRSKWKEYWETVVR